MNAPSKQCATTARNDSLDAIRALTDGIDAAALKVNILLQAIIEKIDLSSAGMCDEAVEAIASIECFVFCAKTSTDAITQMSLQAFELLGQMARGEV